MRGVSNLCKVWTYVMVTGNPYLDLLLITNNAKVNA